MTAVEVWGALVGAAALTIVVSFAIEGYWLVRRRWRWSWPLSICAAAATVLLTVNAAVAGLPAWVAVWWIAATGLQGATVGVQFERRRQGRRPSPTTDQEIAQAVRRHDRRER